MSQPLVSIVMPALNTSRYIGDAIQSAADQTYRRFELLVVDDGSTDGTAAIASRYAARDPRIRVLAGPHRGVSAARNTALRAARGSLVALLDSDDLWTPQYLERQIGLLERTGADVVTANAYNHGGPQHGRTLRTRSDEVALLDAAAILRDEQAMTIMSLFRREVADRLGGFDESLVSNEDYEFWLRTALAGFRIVRTSTPLAFYRRRAGSNSGGDARMCRGILLVYEKTRRLCEHRPAELAALTCQEDRFTRELERAEGRHALNRGDYAQAAAHFSRLADLDGSLGSSLIAAAAWYMPRPFAWMVQLRSVLRAPGSRAASSRHSRCSHMPRAHQSTDDSPQVPRRDVRRDAELGDGGREPQRGDGHGSDRRRSADRHLQRTPG